MSVPGVGGARKGSLHHKAVLNEAEVRKIRARRSAGETIQAIWLDYPDIASVSTIWCIVKRRTWQHV